MHILLLPLIWAAHMGQWIDSTVLSSFQIGTTAKQIAEEELGCYGVLAYMIYKVNRLTIEAAPLLDSRWLAGRALRGVGLAATLIAETWLLTCLYVGTLIPILDLQVSYGGLVLSPAVAWVALSYTMVAERVRQRRAEIEAQAGEEN